MHLALMLHKRELNDVSTHSTKPPGISWSTITSQQNRHLWTWGILRAQLARGEFADELVIGQAGVRLPRKGQGVGEALLGRACQGVSRDGTSDGLTWTLPISTAIEAFLGLSLPFHLCWLPCSPWPFACLSK